MTAKRERVEVVLAVGYKCADDWHHWPKKFRPAVEAAVARYLSDLGHEAKVVSDVSTCTQSGSSPRKPWLLSRVIEVELAA